MVSYALYTVFLLRTKPTIPYHRDTCPYVIGWNTSIEGCVSSECGDSI